MLFTFNEYSSLLLPSFVHGVLFSIILFGRGKRDDRLADKLLALILSLLTLQVAQWMFGFAGWYDVHDWHTTLMLYLPFRHWLLIGPLFYFYFLSVTNYQFQWKRSYWLHFIPAGLWIFRAFIQILMDVVYHHWWQGEAFPYFDGTHGEWLEQGWGFFDNIWGYLEPVSLIFYVVLTLRLFQQYQQYIVQQFSDTGDIHFKWLRNLLIAMCIGFMVWIAFDIVDLITQRQLTYAEDWYSFFFLGLVIYYLSITGLIYGAAERPQISLQFEPNEVTQEVAPEKIDGELIMWKEKINWMMKEQKPHLQSDLSLSQLASELRTSSAMLSRCINAGFDKNFNEFVNEYRVGEVKSKMGNPKYKHLTVLAIALESGFSSKATFNRVFKKLEGRSPSDYLKSLNV